MDELKQYVDKLFARAPKTAALRDLKEEVYTNLKAHEQDLLSQGQTAEEALRAAKQSMPSLEELVWDTQPVYYYPFLAECCQVVLLHALLLWVLLLPLMLVNTGSLAIITTLGAFLLAVGSAVACLVLRVQDTKVVRTVRLGALRRFARTVWLVWAVFFAVCVLAVTAVLFGSNLWFGRPVVIDGPYQFGVLAARYYLPLVTAVLPWATGRFAKLAAGHEAGDGHA